MLTSIKEVSVVEIEDGIFETLSVSYGTHENPTAGKLTQQIIEFIVDTLNPLDSLDPVEVCFCSLNDLKQLMLITHHRED